MRNCQVIKFPLESLSYLLALKYYIYYDTFYVKVIYEKPEMILLTS